MNLPGSPLSDADYHRLESSWISRELADKALLRRADSREGARLIGRNGGGDYAGIVIPNCWPGDPRPREYRLRRDNPEIERDSSGNEKQKAKYLSPPGRGNLLYFTPGTPAACLEDANLPIVLSEGEKKCLALWRLALHQVNSPRFLPMAVPGVWAWRGVIQKKPGPNGERREVKGPIPDLSRVLWQARKVTIIFDTNVAVNDKVARARRDLSRELARRGAKVFWVNISPESGVNGVDDLLGMKDPEHVLGLIARAKPADNDRTAQSYRADLEGMHFLKPKEVRGQTTYAWVPISNFDAEILADIKEDDGAECRRHFEIEARRGESIAGFRIPAEKFVGMNWPTEMVGAAAVIYPNMREHARVAIQVLSQNIQTRTVFAHTGWREIGGEWVYLHAAGAIGAAGPVPSIEVALSGSASRYVLTASKNAGELRDCIHSSLRFLDLAPKRLTVPLYGAIWRASLDSSDLGVWVSGLTGLGKTELVALDQQHFGAAMDARHLPANYASTENALESLAFCLKDALLVVDDFAPSGNAAEVQRIHRVAERLYRAQGNNSGRLRMTSDIRLRPERYPRGLILSTGEDLPRGSSIRARALILEMEPNDLNWAALSDCQRDARNGLYAQAMAGFVQWLAGRYSQVRQGLRAEINKWRDKAMRSGQHRRTPDIIANLAVGINYFLDYAVDCKALTATEADARRVEWWTELLAVAKNQWGHQQAVEPTRRFLELLSAAMTSGHAHLAAVNGGEPEEPAACGWRPTSPAGTDWQPQGERIGWVSGEGVFLQPDSAFHAVQNLGRTSGEGLIVSLQTLKRRLKEKRLLASCDDSRQVITVRRRVEGRDENVLHFSLESLSSYVQPDKPDNESETPADCRVSGPELSGAEPPPDNEPDNTSLNGMSDLQPNVGFVGSNTGREGPSGGTTPTVVGSSEKPDNEPDNEPDNAGATAEVLEV